LNAGCPAQLKGRLIHFGSKEALDIEGLGEKTAEELVQRGMVDDVADLFELSVQEVKDIGRMADKSAQNLVDAIQGGKEKVSLAELIYGLGIPHVGRATADELALEFGSLEALSKAGKKDLSKIEGMGETMISAIAQWFGRERNQKLLKRLKNQGIDPREEKKGGKLEGQTLVFTGSLESMTRDEAKKAVRKQGGNASSSVSGNTDYLVVGGSPGARKREEAKQNNVETIDEKSFLELIGEGD
jgi:DNA ligase (NAD+)